MPDNSAEKELKRLKAITSIHQGIGANLDLEATGRICVRELIDIMGCDGCAILLIEGDQVKILAERGFSETFGEIQFNTTMPAIAYILDTKEAIFTNDVLTSPAARCVPQGCSMCSLVCTPIMVNGEVKGIIHLDSRKKDAFGQEDMVFTEILANEIAIAMERSFLYAQVRDIAIRDGLTGCFNRRKFDVDMVAELANAKQIATYLSLLMLDIDWFKKYNDCHGHQKGDELLKRLVEILELNVRPGDSIYRYGGEEFAILLPEADRNTASYVAERLRAAVEREQFPGEETSQAGKQVTISIGIATFPKDATAKDALIRAADAALYRAKQTGRNRTCAFDVKSS